MKLNFAVVEGKYGVCRLDKDSRIPDWAYQSVFFSLTKTFGELSVVCSQESIPEDIKCERDWKILKVEGILDFSLTGILASISNTLAKAGISIFAVSTYDTDYVLVKDMDFKDAIEALKQAGFGVEAAK